MRLDILYFLGYDIDDSLPCYSIISRTRQLFPESIFEKVFSYTFEMCVKKVRHGLPTFIVTFKTAHK